MKMSITNVPAELETLKINELYAVIRHDWQNIYFGAKPYLSAMFCLKDIDDMYGADSGRDIVAYFLANAQTWKGPVAKAVKAELKRRLT